MSGKRVSIFALGANPLPPVASMRYAPLGMAGSTAFAAAAVANGALVGVPVVVMGPSAS
ncbi:MAG: hypothetical protein PF501_08105 [Salinisphaera sp.]|nr:hypothetical protein [Salinisphaera sp.]